MDRSAMRYWESLAGVWRIAPPLAPCAQDVAFYERIARRLAGDGTPLHALLLGVTPAIATMRWPAATSLLATDWAFGMIRNTWPGERAAEDAGAVCCDWRELPLASKSRDFVVGDGCYTVLADGAGAAQLNREMHRVLRPDGLYAVRCFCRPQAPVPVKDLFDDLLAGRCPNLDLFRWLLAMAVHGDTDKGVRLQDVWEVWHHRVPDPAPLRVQCGWSADALANMERWRTLDVRYFFPTQADLYDLAYPYFQVVACEIPDYARGDRFPRLLMRPRHP